MAERPTIQVASPAGGWGAPWPNVAELAAVLPHDRWTLVGGLMAQLHGAHRGIGVVRPTNDVDIVLHLETIRGVAAQAAGALESLGYRLAPSIDPRTNTAHRFRRDRATRDGTTRDGATVDLVAGGGEVVDVLIADHAAPRVIERLRGRDMVAIEGGTQALRRTVNAHLDVTAGERSVVSVPSAFGALVLKAAAYRADSRDRDRHLHDAVVLLACVEDPFAERDGFTGSDRSRVQTLARALPDDARAWHTLPTTWRTQAQTALRILAG